jgi:hypothetical protein
MSSINNFMDKKIKKYSWIHELNAAAMKAKLLNEAEQYAKHQQFLVEQQNLNESNENIILGILRMFKDAGAEYPHGYRGADALRNFRPTELDIEGEEDESGRGYFNTSGIKSSSSSQDLNPNNSDMDGDGKGTANEVAKDGEDGKMEDYEILGKSGPPTFPNVGMTPSTPAPVPPARFPSNMSPNEITRLGTEDAINRGLIPQRKSRRLQAIQDEMAVKAALRAQAQAKSEGKLPASAKEAGRKAGKQAVRDFKSNLGLEAAARDIMTRNPSTGPRPSEDDLRRMAQILGRG